MAADHQVTKTGDSRYWRAVKAGDHFPSEQVAIKCLYLVTRSLDPYRLSTGTMAVRRKPTLAIIVIISKRTYYDDLRVSGTPRATFAL